MRSLSTITLFLCIGLSAAGDDTSVLVSDDFAKLDSAWGVADDALFVSGGKLHVIPEASTSRTLLRKGNAYHDADVRVKVSMVNGGDEQAAGIVFWAVDYSNYYFAQLFSDGTVGVARRTHGRMIQPVRQAIRDFVRKGAGEVNEIRVVTRGNVGQMFVNDQPVAEFRGFPPAAGGQVGVRAASAADQYTWTFSDFSVRKPPASAVPQPAPSAPDIVFEDDFSELDPAWGPADEVQSVSGNKQYMTPKPNTIYSSLYQGNLFGDSDFRVKISLKAGGPDRAAGALFWATDYQNYYSAELYSDGTLGVLRRQGGKSTIPVQGRVHDAIRQGLDQTNELRVVTTGSYAAISVNGVMITTFRGFPPEGGGKIGLSAASDKEPYTWAFSNLSVRNVDPSTPRRTPPHADDPEVLFADDFATLDPAWGESDALRSVADRKLIVNPAAKVAAAILYNGGLFGDCDIRVKLALSQGGADSPAGILFWAADYDNYYFARLYADGVAGIARRSQGKWSYPASMKVYGAVQEGAGRINELRVVTRGDSVTMYVNDKRIATVTGSPPAGGSRIGLRADSAEEPYRWSFSELMVRKVPHIPEAAAEQIAGSPLPQEIVEAWEAAGARSGWMRTNEFGVSSFITAMAAKSTGQRGELPAFQITPALDPGKLETLPVATSGFGLMIVNARQSTVFDNLAGQRKLQKLILLSSVGDAGLTGLGKLQGLQTLQLNAPKITDNGLTEVARLVNLRSLSLGSGLITDQGLKKLVGLTNLETLNSSGNRVTDAGLEALVGLTKLQMLNLSGTAVSDAGLRHLVRITSLRSLNVANTKVTSAGLQQLQAGLRDCRIIIQ